MSTKLMSCLAGLALAGLIIFSQIALAESVIEKGLTSSKSADFSQGLFNPNKLVSIEIQMAACRLGVRSHRRAQLQLEEGCQRHRERYCA